MIYFSEKERVILPLLVFIFLVNFHFYSFYLKNERQYLTPITINIQKNQYLTVQKQHPYYPIFYLAQKYKFNKRPVILVFNRQEEINLDYTSTAYAKIANPNHFQKKYLSELVMMVNYFFYPRLVTPYTFKEFAKLTLSQKTIIISDSNLLEIYADSKHLKNLALPENSIADLNRRKQSIYYLYEVI